MQEDIIERQFESSFLRRIRYSGEAQLLIVEFKTGGIYQYSAVPDWRVHELLEASSIGKYFSEHIAKSYSFVRLPELPCNDSLNSGQTTVQVEEKQTVAPASEQTVRFVPTLEQSPKDLSLEKYRDELRAKWAEEDQRRTAFMRKMKWSEARMARYERHCKEHEDGLVGFLWFWLFSVASAIVYFSLLAPADPSKETVGLIILLTFFMTCHPLGPLLLSALFTWLRKSYFHRFLRLPVFLPSDRSSIEAGWEAERKKIKDDADYRIRKDAENAERRRELAKQWTEERQRQWLSTPPENWTPYKETVPLQQATPPRPIKPLLVPPAPPRVFPIIPTVTKADVQKQEQLHPSPANASAPTELESALTADLPVIESPSIVEVPTKRRLLPILTGQTPASPVHPSQPDTIDPLESEGPETSTPTQELPSAVGMPTEAAVERPSQLVQRFLAFTNDEREDPESPSRHEGSLLPKVQEAPMPSPAGEGQRKLRTNYEAVRSRKLREAAIQIHGRSCAVCGFNFDEFFGKDLARGYIEVHHLDNIAAGERFTDPAKDLVPLCANCHAMADRLTADLDSPPRSIAELRTLLMPKAQNSRD